MEITSVFNPGESIPRPYTCLGENSSPPLQFGDLPEGTESLVLIFEDVDAAPKPWTHWMVFDIPSATRYAEAGDIPEGGTEGLANNHSFGYEGPCPKYFKGTHHYWLRLYALNTRLELPPATERETVEAKMAGHIIESAELMGTCTG